MSSLIGGPPRRHCMIVHAYYPVGETRVQREAIALRDRGWQVQVYALRGPGEAKRETIDGIAVVRLGARRHRGRGFAVQMLEYMQFLLLAAIAVTAAHARRRFDTIQVHNLPDFLVFAAAIPRLFGTPVILDIHDLMPEFFAARTESTMDRGLVRMVQFQEWVSCRFATHVITVTEAWRQTLAERGVDPAKSSVVMNLADRDLFVRPTERANPDDGPFHVLYHGTFTHRYGVDTIVEAVARLRARSVPVRASLLGDGESRDDLMESVARLGLGEVVYLSPGMLDAGELPQAIASADVGIVPNRSNVFTDGILPTKLLEYVAMGTPVIVSRTPGVENYFDDDQVAYVDPGDVDTLVAALTDLVDNPQRRTDLVLAADRFNDDYRWDFQADEYVALVERLAGA